jgi:hypothetical protein
MLLPLPLLLLLLLLLLHAFTAGRPAAGFLLRGLNGVPARTTSDVSVGL